jgi:hypothetical protein
VIPSKVERTLMKSLYELLGASADDDAEALKKAFRKAVKAHHPDLHPDDLDAHARFREIIAAHALLRDAKQRASYDRQLARQQLRSKRMRTAAVIAAAGALIGGYGLWATMPMSGNVEIKDELAAATGVAVEKQTPTVVAVAKENEILLATIGTAKTDPVKGDNADEPVGAIRMQPANPPDQGEQRHKHGSAEVPTASDTNRSDTPDIAGRELALGPLSNSANVYKARGIAS